MYHFNRKQLITVLNGYKLNIYKYILILMGQCSPDNKSCPTDLNFEDFQAHQKNSYLNNKNHNNKSLNFESQYSKNRNEERNIQQQFNNQNQSSCGNLFNFIDNEQPLKVKNHYKLSKYAEETLQKLKSAQNSIKILNFSSQIYHFKHSKATYQGKFIQQNKPHGLGLVHFQSGEMYYGEFQFGVGSGIGLYVFKNGSYYYGKFIYSSFYGYGCLYYMTQQQKISQHVQSQHNQLKSQRQGDIHQHIENQHQKTKSHNNDQPQFKFLLKNEPNTQTKTPKTPKLHYSPKSQKQPPLSQTTTTVQTVTLMKYMGYFKRGLPHGQGQQIYTDQCYIGNFYNGLKHGIGIYKWSNGLVYQGQFMGGVICGMGKISNNSHNRESNRGNDSNSRGSNDSGNVIYYGEFRDGMKNGVGYFCNWSQGWSYYGEFHNDCLHGKGTKITKQGKIHDGTYIYNRLQGQGFIYHADGTIWKTKWLNGALRQQTKIQKTEQIDNRIRQIKRNHRLVPEKQLITNQQSEIKLKL